MIQEALTSIAIILGSLFILIGGIGLIRLPDFFCRSHAVTKASTLGISLLLIGSWIYLYDTLLGVKVVAVILFQFGTIPLSGHIIGLISYQKKIKGWKPKKEK